MNNTYDSDNLDLISHYGGITHCITINKSYLYVNFGPELAVLDISVHHQPKRIGSLILEGIANDICLIGTYAYVAVYSDDGHRGGLYILDLSDPTNLKTVSFYSTPYPPSNVVVVGTRAFLSAKDAGLLVVDVANPASPKPVGVYQPVQVDEHRVPRVWAVAVAGNYAYVEASGLHIVDISNPKVLLKQEYYDIAGITKPVKIYDQYAFFATYDGLLVLDISNPTVPIELGTFGSYEDWGYISEITFFDHYAFIIGEDEEGSGGLQIIDISNPSNLKKIAHINYPGLAVAVTEGYAYVAIDRGGLRILDITNPTTPVEIGRYLVPTSVDRAIIANQLAYISSLYGGFYIADVSDPLNITGLGLFTSSRMVYNSVIRGNYAYIAEGALISEAIAVDGNGGGFRIVNVSNPYNPTEIGFFSLPDVGTARDLKIINSNAYILWDTYDYETGKSSYRILILDISNQTSITQVGIYSLAPDTNEFEIMGNKFCVDGLRLKVILQPEREAQFSSNEFIELDKPGTLAEIEGLIYKTAGIEGLMIYCPKSN